MPSRHPRGTAAYAAAFLFSLGQAGPSAAQAQARLSVETQPPGAEVWYSPSGEAAPRYMGDTPVRDRPIPAGNYDFLLILNAQDSLWLGKVELRPAQHVKLSREFPKRHAYLMVRTRPESSLVHLDGVPIGRTPYEHHLLLPGRYRLELIPPHAVFLPLELPLQVAGGDSLHLDRALAYRDKAFGLEALSSLPWQARVEWGLERTRHTTDYDSAGTSQPRSLDKERVQWDYPLVIRLGLPHDVEVRLRLPFKSFDAKERHALRPSDPALGVKYTYRPFNLAFDASYQASLGQRPRTGSRGHDVLALGLAAMHARAKLVGLAQAGYALYFRHNADRKRDPGDALHAHLRIGYLLGSWLPYLAASGELTLEDAYDGNPEEGTGGHSVAPEVGAVVDLPAGLELQAGIPFTVLGRYRPGGWGFHLSLRWTLALH